MLQIYILLGSRAQDVVEFVESITSGMPNPSDVRFYVPKDLIETLPDSPQTVAYPSPGTRWTFPKENSETLFIYLDPRGELIEELDEIRAGLYAAHIAPNRIITIVDCENSEHSRKLRDYNEACIYHSDIVLLGNRGDVSKKWLQDYQKSFQKNASPAHFTFLKKAGKVDDPDYILFPEALRITPLFDIDEDEPSLPIEMDANFDINSLEDDPLDPYRNSDSDDFPQKRVPNISDLIN